MKKAIEYVSFTVWGELEYGNGPLFWDGEKWSDDQGIWSWTDEDADRLQKRTRRGNQSAGRERILAVIKFY